MLKYLWFATGVAVAFVVRTAAASPCSSVTRANVVGCALQASLERKAGQAAIRAAQGRVDANDPWLPSAPTLGLTGARREGPPGTTLNYSVNVGLELEVAGQRGARRDAASAERDAEQSYLAVGSRATAVQALRVYFEALAAETAAEVLTRLEAASAKVWEAARAAAERGSAAGIEADIAEAAHLGVVRRKLEAERDARTATLSLAVLVGHAPSDRIDIEGSLEPLAAAALVHDDAALRAVPEVLALRAEARASAARAGAFRRARIPNPTLSAFVERDGYAENVVGLGLAFPLPLPEPLGHMHAGEIAEHEALAERSELLARRRQQRARLELAEALSNYAAAQAIEHAFSPERSARAEAALGNLATEVTAGRMSIRDAVVLQEPLLGLLLEAIEARKSLCLASVTVVWAAGLPLAGGAP